jgi:hypothetical protein
LPVLKLGKGRRRERNVGERESRVVPVGNDPVAEYVRLAAIPHENVSDVEEFLHRHAVGSDTLAVLERPSQPVALLKIHAGEATLFSFLSSQDGRSLVHETFIGKIYDATITQVHAVENLADVSAFAKPERVEIAGSRIGGTINLTSYSADERAALMDALREIIPRG